MSVYPRWRGEHEQFKPGAGQENGLSPLARGTLNYGKCAAHYFRFIPAGAGNTKTGVFANTDGTVYPRWRGEHSNAMQLN